MSKFIKLSRFVRLLTDLSRVGDNLASKQP